MENNNTMVWVPIKDHKEIPVAKYILIKAEGWQGPTLGETYISDDGELWYTDDSGGMPLCKVGGESFVKSYKITRYCIVNNPNL